LGRGVRSPDMTERFITLLPVGYDNYDYLGNPALKPEANHEIDLMVQYTTPLGCKIETALFFSLVQDYITGILLPVSEVKPATKGVYGVKQFENIPKAWLTGMELNYTTPAEKRWQVHIRAAYTYGVNPESTQYLLENGTVTGEIILKNDALPEIPPLEANIEFSYQLFNAKLIPEVGIRMVAAQNHISLSSNEEASPGFLLSRLAVKHQLNKFLAWSGGISNIFNVAYYEHLNRNLNATKYPYYEPGRIYYINFLITL